MEHCTDAVLVTATRPDHAHEAIQAFLLRYRNENTRTSYGIALTQWLEYCREFGIDPLGARRPHVEGFARQLEAAGRSNGTVTHKLNVLGVFFKHAVYDGYADQDPTIMVTRPHVERRSKSAVFTRGEIASMLEAAEASSPQDHALIAVLAHTGMRISEVLQIDVENLLEVRGQLAVEVRRKGGKEQIITFAPVTGWIVRELLKIRGEHGPLFQTLNGTRLCRNGASRVVKRIAKAANVKTRAHPHAFRKTMATLSRNAGIPDREIIAAAGWASPAMLGYYDAGKDTLQANATTALTVFIDRAA